jgi:uncharacterized membrane protein YdbT with pleckstrin-like domain
MGYPTKLLSPGETIQFEMRPHWRALIWPAVLLVVQIAVFALLFMWLTNGIVRWILVAALVVGLIAGVLVPFMRWVTTQYVFTDRRIIIRRGLLTKEGRDVPLAKVNNVTFSKGLLGRIFNFGDLQIDSANVDGSLWVKDVPDVEEIQRDIYRLQEEDDARRRGSPSRSTDTT